MAGKTGPGRNNGAKKPSKEAAITKGGIETNVEGFFGNICTDTPFSPQYGNHKTIGSEMLPTKTGGRGGAEVVFRNKLMKGGK